MAAWVMMPDCGIKKLEQVQARCLRQILETKAHSASDTIEVIANVTPVRLRIQQLCALEYTRIMCKPPEFHLHKMLQAAALKHSDFTPLRFLIHQSKSIRSALEDLSIELEHRSESHETIDDSTVERITLFDTCNSGSISAPQDRVEAFINQHCSQSVIAFADGSTTEEGRGSSAVILIPLNAEAPLDETSQIHSMYTCSLESEIAVIALAMERAADHYTWHCKQTLSEEKLFILTDCNAAINSV